MIIVTGGAGFIGSAMVARLNGLGIRDSVIVDNLGTTAKWRNLCGLQYAEYINKNELFSVFNKQPKFARSITAVIHMGACSSTTETDVDYLMRNNVDYSKSLWKFCLEQNIPFLYASSAATYGNGELGYGDDPGQMNRLRPINPYGYSKQVFDQWVLSRETAPPFWAGFKFFNVYGPNEYHKESMMSLVCKAVPQIQSEGKLKLFKSYKEGIGHGEQKRDFIYVKDVVDVLVHFLDHSGYHPKKPKSAMIKSGIYNLGTGKARSFADLGRACFKSMNLTENFEWIDMPMSIRHQYQYFTEADLTRLRRDGCYDRPFMSLEDGVHDYVQNYLLKEDQYL